jgi:lysozyme
MMILLGGLMFINDAGLDLIKQAEGFSPSAYECPGGVMTIGYGHAIKEDEEFPDKITREEAEKLLKKDVEHAEEIVKRYVKKRLTRNQFSALVSFVYNVGEGNFRSSTLLRYINKDKDYHAAAEFIRWRYANKVVLGGLVKRRLEEALLYLK